MVAQPGSPFRRPYNEIEFERWWSIDEIFTELHARYKKRGSEPEQ